MRQWMGQWEGCFLYSRRLRRESCCHRAEAAAAGDLAVVNLCPQRSLVGSLEALRMKSRRSSCQPQIEGGQFPEGGAQRQMRRAHWSWRRLCVGMVHGGRRRRAAVAAPARPLQESTAVRSPAID
ncbi:hypothetical protein HPB48_007505 [Haemaphysalis longicornis]|uniref:Uncharacterized protein n=1 Tax=Haemaphysalis longicornis TaxID=44386 RepID=A0A9J6GED0_HAELO|nr:hypothetical protein HPB48_007505 [Haemaphysalis longicornis]